LWSIEHSSWEGKWKESGEYKECIEMYGKMKLMEND